MLIQTLQMDVRTIFQFYIWCNFFICFILGSFYFSYGTNENKEALKWFGLSKLLFALSVIFSAWKEMIPATLSIITFLSATYFESITMLRMLNFAPTKWYRTQLIITVTSIVILSLVLFKGGTFNERVLVSSLEMMLIYIIPTIKFVVEKGRNFFRSIYALSYALYCLTITVRGIHVFLNPMSKTFETGTIDIVFYLSTFLIMLVGTLGFLLLIKEKQDMRMQQLLNDKDQFISIISHDLKVPLNSVVTITDLLGEKFNQFSPEKIQDYLRIIHEANQKNFKLLENLLCWSKVKNGFMEFNPEKLALGQLIQQNMETYKQSALDKNITMDFHFSDTIEVPVDKSMMDAILSNLISNAVKFNGNGGKITILLSKNSCNAEISVADSGLGMDESTKSKLFNVSKKVAKNKSGDKLGTGLGLLLCSEFGKKHDGKIWVESELGKGSTFTFTLPLN